MQIVVMEGLLLVGLVIAVALAARADSQVRQLTRRFTKELAQLRRTNDIFRQRISRLEARRDGDRLPEMPDAKQDAPGAQEPVPPGPPRPSEVTAQKAEAAVPAGATNSLPPLRAGGKPVRSVPPSASAADSSSSGDQAPKGKDVGLDLEAKLGSAWLLRIGLFLLAIGAAYFARAFVPRMTPVTKVALSYGGAIALYVLGAVFETKLQRFARPVMAGGLAVGFFVSFASYFVDGMRVLPLWGSLAWMVASIVAIAVVAEKWRSQPTAGLAIFLGHVAAFVSFGQSDTFALVVVVVLSVGAVALFVRHDWLPLSLFAVLAAYGSHLLWILVGDSVPVSATQAFWANAGFITSYYLIFLASDIIWHVRAAARGTPVISRDYAAARTLGPANVVLYVGLTSYILLATDVYRQHIDLFFGVVAAVQFGVALALRARGSRDYGFFILAGVVFATIGVFAAIESLALNVVLAAEALVLLIAGRRTGLWAFHILAQLVLVVNFAHYWLFGRLVDPTTAHYIGGLLVVATYFVKSDLERRWFGSGEAIWHDAGERDPFMLWVATTARRVFEPIAPYVSHVHAVAGSIIFIHLSSYAVQPPTNLYVATGLTGVLMALALYRGSLPFGLAYLTAQLGAVVLVGQASDGAVTDVTGLLIVVWAMGAIAFGFVRGLSGSPSAISHLSLLVAAHVGAAAVILTAFRVIPRDADALWIYLGWLAFAGILVAQQLGVAQWLREAGDLQFPKIWSRSTVLLGVMLGGLVTAFTAQVHDVSTRAIVLLVATAAVLLGVAGRWTHVGVAAAAVTALLAAYGIMPIAAFADVTNSSLFDNAFATWFVGVVTLAMAIAQDRVFSHQTSRTSFWIAVQYGLGIGLFALFAEHRWSFPTPMVVGGALGVGALFASGIVTCHTMKLVGHLTMFTLLLWFGAELADDGVAGAQVVVTSIVFAILLLASERAVARDVPGSEFTPFWRWTYVVAGAGVAMWTFYEAGSGVTAGWSVTAVILMILGFMWRSGEYRRTALGVFAMSIVRVFVVDTRGLTDVGKTVAFLVLGICLIGVGWLYTRFATDIKKWL